MKMEFFVESFSAFKEELIYSNRFFPQRDIREKLREHIKPKEGVIEKETVLYRARVYSISDDENIPSGKCDRLGGKCDRCDNKHDMRSAMKCYITDGRRGGAAGRAKQASTGRLYTGLPEILKKKDELKAWGYSERGSGKPPRGSAVIGRASPQYIPYFYLANSKDTALAEVRPQIGQDVSIAKYEIEEQLKIVDLGKWENPSGSCEDAHFENALYLAFSSPPGIQEKDYIVSQYISEYIKNLGYAGIKFDSSQYNGGVNYVLFSDSSCKFLCSEIYGVERIEIKSKRLSPPQDALGEEG